MKTTITKRTILKAIKEEPLKSGSFVKMKDGKAVSNKNCSVCAVGAVLRRARFGNQDIDDFGDALVENGPVGSYVFGHDQVVEELLANGKYLHALSVKFEILCLENSGDELGSKATKKVRKQLSEFVKANFPNTIDLNPRY